MKNPHSVLDENLLDTALDVVRRFRAFESYGSVAKACRALQRRCPGFSAERYTEAFQQGEHLYDVAVEVVERNKELLFANWDHLHDIDYTEIDKEMQTRCPAFRADTCGSALGWVFYWHYLR